MMMLIICHHPPRHINGTLFWIFGLQHGLEYLHKRFLRSYDETKHTICVTIESIISYRLLEDMLRDKSPHLLTAMNLIADARTFRKKEANECIAILNKAIEMLHNFDDHGLSNFMHAQALCLRALSRYEEDDSSLKAFIKDVDSALKLWSNNEFVDKNTPILQYTTKLLHFVFDVLITVNINDIHVIKYQPSMMTNIANEREKTNEWFTRL